MGPDELIAAARAWRAEDPDPETRAEIDALLGDGRPGTAPDAGGPDLDGLRERFGARLAFGTAGLRGEMGAGPNRMNRAVVIRATAGLAAHLTDRGHGGEPVVVGFDARHRSATFAADVAAVLAGSGFPVHLADRPLPTPVVAFGVRHLGCCAGVQITASHNPPGDNGYKLYLGDGAQIVPPVDREIAARIDAVGRLADVPRARPGDPAGALVRPVGDELVAAYVDGAVDLVDPDGPRDVRVVYTPLHGVGRATLDATFARAGFPPPIVVPSQAAPDPDFPTVACPNPEEPGVLDPALALADEARPDVVLAHDPDADRLAVAVPGTGGTGGWRVLTGDEIGVLLADWLLERTAGPDRLVVSTVVSSAMLGRLAAARGVVHAEVLTGFKWIARAALDRPDLRFVFGYEEALGQCVGTLVRDKDGITAALVFAELVAAERAGGRTVLDRLDDLSRELGVHVTGQRSIPMPGLDGVARQRALVARLATDPPRMLAGLVVHEVEDLRTGTRLPPAEVVVLRGDGIRLVVRPSGTEPKLKCYAEAVEAPGPGPDGLASARARATARVEAVLDDAGRLAGR